MGLRGIYTFLSKTKYREELKGKQDVDAVLEKRLEKCALLCELGIANLFWKGTTLVFKEMKEANDPKLVYNIAAFTFCLLCMTMGTVAAWFPDTSPFPFFMAGTGALMAILSMFWSYHLDLLAYFPSTRACCISMALASTIFTIYWAYAVQDPWIVHLLARLISGMCNLLASWISRGCSWLCSKAKEGGTKVKEMNNSIRSWRAKQSGKQDPLLGSGSK